MCTFYLLRLAAVPGSDAEVAEGVNEAGPHVQPAQVMHLGTGGHAHPFPDFKDAFALDQHRGVGQGFCRRNVYRGVDQRDGQFGAVMGAVHGCVLLRGRRKVSEQKGPSGQQEAMDAHGLERKAQGSGTPKALPL